MIPRRIKVQIEAGLSRQAAVALMGPRQVGKTTLAKILASQSDSVFLDLESPTDRQKLADPEFFLNRFSDRLVILDEIHRIPELFQVLRVLIDEGRRQGRGKGRFLLLGSAGIELLGQSGESLAGRIEFVHLTPFQILELSKKKLWELHWLRGGFPESYLAQNDSDSFKFRQNFIRTYLERDVPMLGPRIPAETLERFWTMLAHSQGSLFNASKLAAGLGVSSPTVSNYLGLMVDLLLMRRLPPFLANVKKRLVKSPKVYLRDSGILHALLGIRSMEDLLGHPIAGMSWEGYVIENLLAVMPERTLASFYRTSAGAEIDLVLELGGSHGIWAIEIKKSTAPKLERGFHLAVEDIQPNRVFVVYTGQERYPKSADIEVLCLRELAQELEALE